MEIITHILFFWLLLGILLFLLLLTLFVASDDHS
jgi:hypothetical protein